ncbi:MAG: hypothetical protein D6701_08490 [Gemmatimonadetes bacterium]|nr:MAG: hypothetical protein D6701_08490 [Gemmatimonadota bacterium]
MMKSSLAVLRLDKELMVFPVLSGLATILVTASFLTPAFAFGSGWDTIGTIAEQGGYDLYFVAFLYYLACYFVVFFFNTALVGAAMIRLEGGDPTVSDGLRIAFDRLPSILGYAAIAATVGMILRMVEERLGVVGRFVAGLLGVAWSLATYLTVPILVTRDVGAIDAVKESAQTFRRTWGEQVIANASIGLASFVIVLLMTALFVPALIVAGSINGVLVLGVVASFIGGIIFLSILTSALQGIYSAALYRYATTGDPGGPFDAGAMGAAFRERKKFW